MAERIVVDVIEMMMQVSLVATDRLPIPSRPDSSFTLAHPAGGNGFTLGEHSGKTGLDQAPTQREVSITRRQAPQTMHVVRL